MTDFVLHSIGVILGRLGQLETLSRFSRDLFIEGAIRLVRLGPEDMECIIDIMERFHLDFDDAYQYAAAEKYNLVLISFDGDFDRTERGRTAPAELLP